MVTYKFPVIILLILIASVVNAQNVWNTQNSGVNNVFYDVFFTDENSGWISGHGGIILHTSNGGIDWEVQNVPSSNYYASIFFTDNQNGWSAGFNSMIIHTSDGGSNWTLQSTPTQYGISDLYFTDGNTGWAVGGKGRTFTDPIREIFHTANGGNSWTIQYSGSNEEPLAAVYFLDDQNGWAVGNTSTIMHTTNGGNDWNFQMSGAGYEFSAVFFINENIGWVVGEDLSVNHFAVIFKTTDGGANWDFQTFPSGQSFQGVQFINESTGWVVGGDNTEAYILYTDDGGTNWTYQDPGTNNFLNAIFFPDDINGWAVGWGGTILHTEYAVPVELISFTASINNGTVKLNWTTSTEKNNSGFEIERKETGERNRKTGWEKIGFVDGNGTTTEQHNYSFTDKENLFGIYNYRLKQIDFNGAYKYSNLVEVSVPVPARFSLEQNYPNPFNPSTNLSFIIGHSSFVSFKVYDILGNEVAVLVNEEKPAGKYNIIFDGKNLASGIYFYQLKTDINIAVKKMILIK